MLVEGRYCSTMKIINTQIALDILTESLLGKKIIYVDTEFMWRDSYYPILSLIQISDGDKEYVIDTQSKINFSQLKDIFHSNSILKVFHSYKQDLLAIKQLLEVEVNNIYDTQIAAQFIGYESPPSYATLASDLLKKTVSKGMQNANWLLRPISEEMLQYAAHDVKFLPDIRKKINRKLKSQKKLAFFEEEMQNIPKYQYPSIYSLAQSVKVKTYLTLPQAKRLTLLVSMREQQAQKLNMNRELIIDSQSILTDSKSSEAPTQYEHIFDNEIITSIDIDEISQIASNLIKPFKKTKIPATVMALLSSILNNTSSELSISKMLIANTSDLRAIAQGTETKAITGWRYKVFGEKALKTLCDSQI